MYNHIAVMAQAVDMTTPNWTLLGIIFGIMAIIAILLLIPSKDVKALEDAEKKSKPALKFDAKKAIEDNSDESLDKSKQSLAEIKASKRAVVSEEKSKEEMRELRKARRAATQTEKAIQEREVKASEKVSDADEVHEEIVEKEDKKEVVEQPENTANNEAVLVSESTAEASESSSVAEEQTSSDKDSSKPSDLDIANSNNLMVDVNADTGDMFATLFGDNAAKDTLSFDEILGGSPASVDDGTIFPTLGSALIPLNELEKASNEKTDSIDALDELTRRFSDRAEKKTLQ